MNQQKKIVEIKIKELFATNVMAKIFVILILAILGRTEQTLASVKEKNLIGSISSSEFDSMIHDLLQSYESSPSRAVTIEAQLSGSLNVSTAVNHYFKNSFNCYPGGKGVDNQPFPDQIVPLIEDKKNFLSRGRLIEVPLVRRHYPKNVKMANPEGESLWESSISFPFPRIIRKVKLGVNINEVFAFQDLEENQRIPKETSIKLNLNDEHGSSNAIFSSSDCNHEDGISSTTNANISGTIQIRYFVPPGVRFIEFERSDYSGIFKEGTIGFSGILNKNIVNFKNKKEYLWVVPKSEIVLTLSLDVKDLGNADLLNATFSLKPINNEFFNLSNMENYVSSLLNQNSVDDSLAKSFIAEALVILKKKETISSLSLEKKLILSQNLFKLSNLVIQNASLGPSVKIAAALSSFQLSTSLMEDFMVYCKMVEISPPSSSSLSSSSSVGINKVKTLGLRASGYWLLRSLLILRNGSYKEFENNLKELSLEQEKGLSFADVFNDIDKKNKFQLIRVLIESNSSNNFEKLQLPMSLSFHAFSEFQKIEEQLEQNINTDSRTYLFEKLKLNAEKEKWFLKNISELSYKIKAGNQEKINVSPLNEILRELQKDQITIVSLIEKENFLLVALAENLNVVHENSYEKKNLFSNFMTLLLKEITFSEAIFNSENQNENFNKIIPEFKNIFSNTFEANYFQSIIENSRACIMSTGENK